MKKIIRMCFTVVFVLSIVVIGAAGIVKAEENVMDSIVFGGGCFWCLEPAFRLADGVTDVRVGYTGGTVPNPTYRAVCTGTTGHAEVVKVVFDPGRISLEQLMKIFLTIHDPTQLNRQGADIGTQYRSAVFCHSDEQAEAVKLLIKNAQASFQNKIVTTVLSLGPFYEADEDHQLYFEKNPTAGYCRMVIAPKVNKVRRLLNVSE